MELSPTLGAPAGFPFEEKHARLHLGWNKDEARALRKIHLSEEDYVVHKKRVYLSEAALEKLCMAARVPLPKKNAPVPPSSNGEAPAPEKTAVASPEVTLRVVRADLKNPHLILACLQDDDPDRPERQVRVRVKSPTHFTPRMEIPARLIPGYSDFYELTRACPRQRGKW